MTDYTDVYLVDANVLIDYLSSDITILTIYSNEIGQIYVPTGVLENVKQLSIGECNRLNLKIVEPTIEQYFEAGPKIRGLAFDDRICLILARDNQWTCITNDKKLRAICMNIGISVVWGLEIMLPLVEKKLIEPSEALNIAKEIQESNPRYVNKTILKRFEDKINKIIWKMDNFSDILRILYSLFGQEEKKTIREGEREAKESGPAPGRLHSTNFEEDIFSLIEKFIRTEPEIKVTEIGVPKKTLIEENLAFEEVDTPPSVCSQPIRSSSLMSWPTGSDAIFMLAELF